MTVQLTTDPRGEGEVHPERYSTNPKESRTSDFRIPPSFTVTILGRNLHFMSQTVRQYFRTGQSFLTPIPQVENLHSPSSITTPVEIFYVRRTQINEEINDRRSNQDPGTE